MRPKRNIKGLAIPVSLSILLFSFTILTVATYHFAISSVNSRSGRLNYAAAKEDMLALDDSITSVTWSPGSSVVQYFDGYGERFETLPGERELRIKVEFGSSSDLVFDAKVGCIKYETQYSDFEESESFLRGDERTIVNWTYAEKAQMYIASGGNTREIYLGYRPLAVSFLDSSYNNLTNVVRIYLINLNSSQSLLQERSFHLRVRCESVTVETRNYVLSQAVSFATVMCSIDSKDGTVILPISNNGNNTLIRTEILLCNIELEEVNG